LIDGSTVETPSSDSVAASLTWPIVNLSTSKNRGMSHGKAFGGGAGWRRRNLTGGFQAGGGNEDEIPVLLDLARVAQCLASGVVNDRRSA
jgi:hypothetical protein